MTPTRVALLLAACLTCASAQAHKPSDSYLRLTGGQAALTAEWDIALKDLEFLIGLDSDQDGQITWGELKTQRTAIEAHALSRLRLTSDGEPADLAVTGLRVTRHSDGAYAVLLLDTGLPGDATTLGVEYRLLFDADPTHRGLVLYRNGGVESTHVLGPDGPTVQIATGEAGLLRAFREYTAEGVWHIWIGLDHILFLVCLLLPAVWTRRDAQGWVAADTFRAACGPVLKIVTMFTLAHSITLWLAVTGYVTLPAWLVESAIALSIVVTALNNLWPVLPLSNWAIAFLFGLVHGFGFANVLLDLGLSDVTLAVSLLGFNVGVELGQLAIVLAFLPLAYLLRETPFYRWGVFRAGSVAVAGVAAVWVFERMTNTEVLGF